MHDAKKLARFRDSITILDPWDLAEQLIRFELEFRCWRSNNWTNCAFILGGEVFYGRGRSFGPAMRRAARAWARRWMNREN